MKKRKSRVFLCFIGIDGSGKTAQAMALCKELSKKGINCAYVRPRYALLRFIPSALRKWINKRTYVSPRKLTIPYKARETLNIRRIFKIPLTIFFLLYVFLTYSLCIEPLLNKFIVVCDRYFFDWFYNLWGDVAIVLTRLLPRPDLTFLLDVPVTTAFSRMRYIEDKKILPEYYESLRDWYLILARQRGFFVIDSSVDFDNTRELVLGHVRILL